MSWTTVPDTSTDADSPPTAGLFSALRDNPLAIAAQSAGAPDARGALLAALDGGATRATLDGSPAWVWDLGTRNAEGQAGDLFRSDFASYTVWIATRSRSVFGVDPAEIHYAPYALRMYLDGVLTAQNAYKARGDHGGNPDRFRLALQGGGAAGDAYHYVSEAWLTIYRPATAARHIIRARGWTMSANGLETYDLAACNTSPGALTGLYLTAQRGADPDEGHPADLIARVYGHR